VGGLGFGRLLGMWGKKCRRSRIDTKKQEREDGNSIQDIIKTVAAHRQQSVPIIGISRVHKSVIRGIWDFKLGFSRVLRTKNAQNMRKKGIFFGGGGKSDKRVFQYVDSKQTMKECPEKGAPAR